MAQGDQTIELTLLANPSSSEAPVESSASPNKGHTSTAPWWHPEERGWVALCVLVLSCFLGTGNYFSYLSIGVVQTDIQAELGLSASKFNWLYSAYSVPNFILPFVGGFILDSIGIRVGLFLTLSLSFAGTLLVAIAAHLKSFELMLVGRLLFGVGGDTVYVAQNTICCAWFKNRFLAVCMGLMVSAGRLGTALTFLMSPAVVESSKDWKSALWLAVGVSGFSLLCGIGYNFVERWAERVLGHKLCQAANDIGPLRCGDLVHTVRSFPREYWLMVFVAVVYYCVVFPFEGNGVSILTTYFDYDLEDASAVVAILPITSAILSPIFGFFVDIMGHRLTVIVLGLVVTTTACIMLATQVLPVLSIVLLGMAFSLVPSAVWPCLPLMIAPHTMGIAFGLISVAMNIGLAGAYPLVGHLRDNNATFDLVLFIIFAVSGLVCAYFWKYLDRKNGSVCNGPGRATCCGGTPNRAPPL